MKEESTVRTKWLHIRLTEEEYAKIEGKFKRSTCVKKSEFARSLLLDKVITVYSRNASLDALINELTRLGTELLLIQKTFETLVTQLHTLEKKEGYNKWLLLYEGSRKILLQEVQSIKEKIAQIVDVWLQS